MYFFTSITNNYIPKARILCKTLKKHNPEAKFVLALSDEVVEGFSMEEEPFDEIITIKDIDAIDNYEEYIFKHTVTELCTAIKPLVAKQIITQFNAKKVVYLDPDIGVFDSLKELSNILDAHSMVFTPHQTLHEKDDSFIKSNEILFLKRGTMNLGFFGVNDSDEAIRFLDWWGDRLYTYCFDDDYETLKDLTKDGLLGMFTDQKWIDLVPAYFDNYYILKEPGYNLCTWNLTNRTVSKKDNKYYVNDKPIYFFHFSGFDSGGHLNELQRICEINEANVIVKELSQWYANEHDKNGQKDFGNCQFAYSHYNNGELIQNFERKLYHIRKDVYEYFPNPFNVSDGFCFYNWVRKEYKCYFQKTRTLKKEIIPKWKKIFYKIFPPMTKRNKYAKKVYFMLRGNYDNGN